MLFWRFFVTLLIASIVFSFIYSKSIDLVDWNPRLRGTVVAKMLSIPFVYILLGWSAYVVTCVGRYSYTAGVTHSWLYYVVGFLLCHIPLVCMDFVKGPENASWMSYYVLMAMVAYIAFAMWPTLMEWPYGWFLKSLA